MPFVSFDEPPLARPLPPGDSGAFVNTNPVMAIAPSTPPAPALLPVPQLPIVRASFEELVTQSEQAPMPRLIEKEQAPMPRMLD